MFCNFLLQILCGLQANYLCLLYFLFNLEFSFSFSRLSERKKNGKMFLLYRWFLFENVSSVFSELFWYTSTEGVSASICTCRQPKEDPLLIQLHTLKLNEKQPKMGCREKDTTGYKMYRTKHLITDLNEKENYKFSHMPCCLLSVQ